jgi:hypothetical protein
MSRRKYNHEAIGRDTVLIPFGTKGQAVLFLHEIVSGMVGEGVYSHRAYLIQFNGFGDRPSFGRKRLEYDQLRAIYRSIKGRYSRKEFWAQYRQFSPAWEAMEEQASYDEAMRIVR